MSKNNSINFWRFIFTLSIVVFHFSGTYNGFNLTLSATDFPKIQNNKEKQHIAFFSAEFKINSKMSTHRIFFSLYTYRFWKKSVLILLLLYVIIILMLFSC